MTPLSSTGWRLTRRVFLQSAAGALAAAAAPKADAPFRFGVVTDVHYADRPPAGTRHYRLGISKLRAVAEFMNSQGAGFLIELGDFKDQDARPSEERTLAYLRDIEAVFRRFRGPRYHVLGNHDLDSITKGQFQAAVKNSGIPKERTWYSFRRRGYHFAVLDANFRKDMTPYNRGHFDWQDTNLSPDQTGWLHQDLRHAEGPCVVFVHQRLDECTSEPSVANRIPVRQILEDSRKTPLVMQGHSHSGGHQIINGIHYYTLAGSVEGGNAGDQTCAIVSISRSGRIEIAGYERALSRSV